MYRFGFIVFAICVVLCYALIGILPMHLFAFTPFACGVFIGMIIGLFVPRFTGFMAGSVTAALLILALCLLLSASPWLQLISSIAWSASVSSCAACFRREFLTSGLAAA